MSLRAGQTTMLKIAKLMPLLIGTTCLISTQATANTTDLAVLSDKSAKITAAKSWKCSSNASVTVEAADASFFEARLNDLGMLYGAALSQLSSGCPSLSQISISGKTASFEVIKGRSKKSDGWTLRLDQPNLTKEALRISERVKTFDDLEKLLSTFAPFRTVPGIANTSGYTLFAQSSQNAVQSLLNDPAHFDKFVQTSALELGQEEQQKKIEAALGIIQLYAPHAAQDLRLRAPKIQRAVLNSAALRVLEQTTNRNTTISAVVSNTHTHLSAKTPDTTTLAEVDTKLAEWIEERVLQHEAKTTTRYLDSARAHSDFAQSVGASDLEALLPETDAAIDTASFWFEALSEEILAENVAQAQSLIETSGSTYQEIDLILETGLTLHNEFLKFGFETEADDLLKLAKTHIEGAITNGLDAYKSQMQAESMTLERVTFYQEEADLFFELSQDYPGFSSYVEANEEGIKLGQLQACAVVAGDIENHQNQGLVTIVDGQSLSLKSLACALYANGHLLTDVSVAKNRASGSVSLLENNENERVFEIVASDEDNIFLGVSDAWDGEMGTLILPPPTGKPNRNGVTECDQLAGDPNDPTLKSKGVILEDVSIDYDFDRAVEACIAAVEHDPSNTRQVYQLARILEFLGDAETAAHYAEVAATRKYAPAIHLQAFTVLTYREDDDAFFDAIDLLKVSSGLGYGPSKTELSELMPPGVELFRERPPPSDEQILDAVGRKRCESNIFAKACSIRTGVAKKSCFQTAEHVFSCELVLRHRCTMNTGMDGDPLMQMFTGLVTNSCSPTTDPMFMKLTKSGEKWSARKEF